MSEFLTEAGRGTEDFDVIREQNEKCHQQRDVLKLRVKVYTR